MARTNVGARLRLGGVALIVAALAFVAPLGPSATTPAGAWGIAPAGAIGCDASGFSGRWGNWIGVTSDSNCGSNWVRFRGWGTVGDWHTANTPTGALVESASNFLLGGADHKACSGCTIVGT